MGRNTFELSARAHLPNLLAQTREVRLDVTHHEDRCRLLDQQLGHLVSPSSVQRRKRLVEQQQPRRIGESTPDGDALALSARQPPASSLEEMRQPQSLRQRSEICLVRPGQVRRDRAVREEQSLLGHPSEATLPGRHGHVPVEQHPARVFHTALRVIEPQEDAQEGSLADARWATDPIRLACEQIAYESGRRVTLTSMFSILLSVQLQTPSLPAVERLVANERHERQGDAHTEQEAQALFSIRRFEE